MLDAAISRLAKHMEVCKRTRAAEPLKRAETKKWGASTSEGAPTPPKKKPNWQKQHQEFQAMLKRGKGDGGDEVELEDDRVACPKCGRKFAPRAAERHIPGCKVDPSRRLVKGGGGGGGANKGSMQIKPGPPVRKGA